MNRDDKAAVIDRLASDFGEVETLFVADYRGLDVSSITELRDEMYGHDAEFRVVKNTLARRAVKQAGYDDAAELFVGPSAVTFVRGDIAAVAKVLDEVAKRSSALEIRGGYMDGKVVDAAQVAEIAKLPSREVILAMFVSAIGAPLSQTVGALAAPPRDFVMVLDAYIEKRKQEEAAA